MGNVKIAKKFAPNSFPHTDQKSIMSCYANIAGSTWPPQQYTHKTSEYLTYGFIDDFRQQGKPTADLKNGDLATLAFKKSLTHLLQ